jgi:hypothetical protein
VGLGARVADQHGRVGRADPKGAGRLDVEVLRELIERSVAAKRSQSS